MAMNEEKQQDETARENRRKRAREVKRIFMRVEIIIGIIAMIAGAWLTVLVWSEGYFPGALMLVMTGGINVFLAAKELINPTDHIFHWQSIFFLIVRRAMFFLNVVLIALVLGTMTRLLSGINSIRPRGQALAHSPQPTHLARSTTATPSCTRMACSGQTVIQEPKPRQP